MTEPCERAHARMTQQSGLITREQALAIPGMTAGMVDGLLARGRWESPQGEIYRVAGGPVPPQQLHLAAVWRAGSHAFLTAAPALALHGVEGFTLDTVPIVLVPLNRRVRNVNFEVRHRAPLGPADRAFKQWVPVATPTRALVDEALTRRGENFRVAFDAVRRAGLTTEDRLRRRALAALPQRGAQWVVDLVDSGVLRQESEAERILAGLFADADPPLEAQVWVLPDVRVDFAWLDVKLIIEYDGKDHHTLATDRRRDRQRRSRLRAAGYAVFVVTHEMLQEPHLLRRRVLALRAARAEAIA